MYLNEVCGICELDKVVRIYKILWLPVRTTMGIDGSKGLSNVCNVCNHEYN